jgi:hypothetical protein
MSNLEDGAVAEASACSIEASLDAGGVGIRIAHATLSYVSLSSIDPNPFRDLNPTSPTEGVG